MDDVLEGDYLNTHDRILTKLAILGGGPAGYVGAIRAAQLGASVVLIEEREIGGVCLNRGCIPTKSFLYNAEAVSRIKKAAEMGIESAGFHLDWAAVLSRKERVVKNLRMGLESLLAARKVNILRGRGTVLNPGLVSVETAEGIVVVECEKILITTGSEPAQISIAGADLPGVISSDQALELKAIPESMVIIGSGAIGLEFASIFMAVGSKITVIEKEDRILPNGDREISAELLKILKRQGVGFKLSAAVGEIRQNDSCLLVRVEENGKESLLPADKVLLAVGRTLRAAGSDLVKLGVRTQKGAILVNEKMETSVPGVYAAGDVVGGKLLAHLAYAEGRVAVENALGLQTRVNYAAVPDCVYTHPEAASVGINQWEAADNGIPVKTGRFDFRNNGRALTMNQREGFVKVVIHRDSGVILGGQILGANASEMISELTLAITLGATALQLAEMIHPHPTLSEAVMEACADAVGNAIHKA